jgi:hypothetical protein
MKKHRTEIIVETHEVLTVRTRRSSSPVWCSECAEPSRMFTPSEASAICRVSPRTIYCWIEAQKVHFHETPEGAVFICLHSMPPWAGEANSRGSAF